MQYLQALIKLFFFIDITTIQAFIIRSGINYLRVCFCLQNDLHTFKIVIYMP